GAVRALRDFDESHVCAGFDHSGIGRKPGSVDRLRTSRNRNVRADSFDLAVTNHNCAVLDVWTTHGDDASVANREGAARWNHALLRGWIADLLGRHGGRANQNCK